MITEGMMEKKIGEVVLEYKYYPGKDYYSDGGIEDEMLDIVMNYEEADYNSVITQKKSWPIMYHLSDKRENVLASIAVDDKDMVLEIGSGCGAVTGALTKRAKHVDCIELSEKRSMINAYRHRKADNLRIILGNFEEIEKNLEEKYDVITLIGVLEYGGLYINSDTPYFDFLKMVKRHLKPKGKLVIAIENKYGLKYFAGCKEDHVGKIFAGIEGYDKECGVATFSRNTLHNMIMNAGFRKDKFYYPYPDYKFTTTIYTDDYLPKYGELTNNIRNYDMERLYLFDECKAFGQICEDGLFPVFSNSFLVEAFA